MHDEPMDERPRRRPVLLAMLVAAALLLAIAGTGAFAGNGPSRSSDDGTGVTGAPPAAQGGAGAGAGQGFMHHGRHCHHDQGGQQAPTGAPPV